MWLFLLTQKSAHFAGAWDTHSPFSHNTCRRRNRPWQWITEEPLCNTVMAAHAGVISWESSWLHSITVGHQATEYDRAGSGLLLSFNVSSSSIQHHMCVFTAISLSLFPHRPGALSSLMGLALFCCTAGEPYCFGHEEAVGGSCHQSYSVTRQRHLYTERDPVCPIVAERRG